MKTAREIIFSLEDRFKPEEIDDDLSILFHFDISGDNGGQFSVKIEDETCNVSEGLSGEPKCLISCAEDVYADIELGRKNAQMALMTGEIKISNIMAMIKFINCFDKLH
jgi:putative sterol carrier protein